MTIQRRITKTGAELQDVVELLDQLTGEVFLPFTAFEPLVGSPAVTAVGGSTAAAGYAFDATSAESITSVVKTCVAFPGYDYSESANLVGRIIWSAAATSGDCVWDLDMKGTALGGDYGGTAVTTKSNVETTGSTADAIEQGSSFAFSASTGFGDCDYLSFTIRRDAGEGADTMTGDANVLGLLFTYTTNPNIV